MHYAKNYTHGQGGVSSLGGLSEVREGLNTPRSGVHK